MAAMPVMAVAVAAAAAAALGKNAKYDPPACPADEYRLPNGICIPAAGPQGERVNAPPVQPTQPPYLAAPPTVINISIGRQLFVDDFLLLDPSTTRTSYHQAEWLPESLMNYDEPWESWPLEDHERCPAAAALVTSRPYSGGLWTMPDGTLRLYYLCPGKNATGPEPWARIRIHSWTGGLCLATSVDTGMSWQKPKLPIFNGTNIVLTQVSDGITVWRDDTAADPNERWVAAAVPESNACMAFALWSSPDGIHWTKNVAKSGPINDRSTIYIDRFRSLEAGSTHWVASIKDNFGRNHNGMQMRARSFYSTTDILQNLSTQWVHHGSSCPPGLNCPYAWVGADEADPPNPDEPSFPAELYNLDVIAYESVNVGLFSIFRGFGGGGNRITGELDELHAGFTRDGFHWFRQLPRRALMPYSWPEFSPHRSDVQSIANGLLATDETITIFASSRSGLPFSGPKHSPGGNHTVVAARLRRDGFASISNAGRVGGAIPTVEARVITRTVVWDVSLVHLFVNVKIAPGGWCRVGLRDPQTNVTLSGFDPRDSMLIPSHHRKELAITEISQPCIADGLDSTRAAVKWLNASDLAPVSGQPVQLIFELEGASLYSFWVSDDLQSGKSRGFLGASGRDV